MRLQVTTRVNQEFRRSFSRFGRDLFLQLNPPFPPVRLLRFDGMQPGDEVHLELNFLFRKEIWISVITELVETEDEIYFVDEGRQLPFMFRSWRHLHRLIRQGEQTLIVDDITYQGRIKLLDYLLYPVLKLQFLYRRPVYRRWLDNG